MPAGPPRRRSPSDPPVVSRLEHGTSLRRAVDQGEFRLHYPPLVDPASEALVGWGRCSAETTPSAAPCRRPASPTSPRRPGRSCRSGGRCWRRRAARRAWREHDPAAPPFAVFINLSARQFRRSALAAEVAAALAESGLDAASLELEITESVVMDHAGDSGRTLAGRRALGVRLAIDDFGTGSSSLSYLRRLSIDALKIDQSVLRDLDGDDGAVAILQAITTMAHDLGMTVTAEGVETAGQLARLRDLGVDRGQGCFFAHPLPAEGIEGLVAGVGSRQSVVGSR